MIQDIILMSGGFVFIIALIPSVLKPNKPNWLTCLITGIILLIYVSVYISLGLVLAAISSGVTALLWFILLVQSRRILR